MNHYYELLKKKAVLKKDIQKEKKKLHKDFILINRKLVRYLDIAVIVMVLFNFGAVATTNAMVIKKRLRGSCSSRRTR